MAQYNKSTMTGGEIPPVEEVIVEHSREPLSIEISDSQ